MPDRKITDLTALITITNNNSPFTLVDLDEASPADQNKKITFADLVTNIESELAFGTGTVKISSNDTTPDFIANKFVAGTNITLTENNDGGVETFTIDATVPSGNREQLTADRTYYVNQGTGSDTNDGLTPGAPFLTLDKALLVVEQDIDCQGYQVTISIAPGTYVPVGESFHLPTLVGHDADSCIPSPPTPNAPLRLIGDNESTVILDGVELDHEMYCSLSTLTVRAVDLDGGGSTAAIRVSRRGTIEILNVSISNPSGTRNGLFARDGGQIIIRDNLNVISGAFFDLLFAENNGLIYGNGDDFEEIVISAGVTTVNFAAVINGIINLNFCDITFDATSQVDTVRIRNGHVILPPAFDETIVSINPTITNPLTSGYYYGTLNQIPVVDTFVSLEAGTPSDTIDDGVIRVDNSNDLLFFRSSSSWLSLDPNATVDTKQTLVTSNDTTEGYLFDKIVAGTSISVVELNDGADEDLQINFTGVATDELVKISANDTTADYLFNKIVAGTSISLVELNDAGDEDLQINFTGVATDELVKISANDTTAGYLFDKIVAGAGVVITELNDAGDEDLEIQAGLVLTAEQTGTINANVNDLVLTDVSAGTATVNPPGSPSANDTFAVSDSRGNANTNNITVDFVTAGDNLHGTSQNDVINVDEAYREYVYVNGTVGWIRKGLM